jgi:GR25 family glycosyltransferase involved in LPS biosynthesis
MSIEEIEKTVFECRNGKSSPDNFGYLLSKLATKYCGDIFSSSFHDNFSILSYAVKDFNTSLDESLRAMNMSPKSETDYTRFRFNQHFCLENQEIKNRYSEYNEKNIAEMISSLFINRRKSVSEKKITVTMTCCKRLQLFQKTVNSFINCCQDKNLIDEWVVVDDNSSEEDRTIMKEMYPFIKFIFKTPSEKGHAKSMNILINQIKTPYIFHIEDDWCFFCKDNYLSKCLSVLESNKKYGQCLVNREYGEDSDGHEIFGGTSKFLECPHLHYYVHEYLSGNELEKFVSENTEKKHCIYWPHFSLRVGMTSKSVIDEVGSFNEEVGHFEMEYANRYVQKGYLTTFLDTIFCFHTGRKTSERFDNSKLNAYNLNGTNQFDKPKKEVGQKSKAIRLEIDGNGTNQFDVPKKGVGQKSKVIRLEIDENGNDKVIQTNTDETDSVKQLTPLPLTEKNYKMDSLVISLPKRIHKMKTFIEKNHEEIKGIQYKLFQAIDGTELQINQKICKLFETGDFNYRLGMMGCAMSHIKLWHQLIINPNVTSLLIFEDDAVVCKNFVNKLSFCVQQLPEKWDVLFLGHHLYPSYRDAGDRKESMLVCLEKWDETTRIQKSMGGTFAYMISKEGAIKIIENIFKKGVFNGIDWVMLKTECDIFYTYPHIAFSEFPENETEITSDIQKSTKQLDVSSSSWLNADMKYFMNELGLSKVSNLLSNDMKKEITLPEGESSVVARDAFPTRDELLSTISFIYIKNNGNIPQITDILRRLPIKFYFITDSYLVVVPQSKITEKILNDITFNGYINLRNPV